METGITHQFAILQRIAAFSAAVRGHELGDWEAGEDFVLATCVQCGATLRVHCPVFQPDMNGAALERSCDVRAVAERAA